MPPSVDETNINETNLILDEKSLCTIKAFLFCWLPKEIIQRKPPGLELIMRKSVLLYLHGE